MSDESAGPEVTKQDPPILLTAQEVDGLLLTHGKSRAATYVGSLIMIALLVALTLIPVPYIRLSPGPLYNTIGSLDGVELITITGTATYPTAGELNLMTVTERGGPFGGLTLPEAFAGWVSSDDLVVPVGALYAPETSGDDARTENAAKFTSSESAAVAASLGYLKIPVTSKVVLELVVPGGPSIGKLQAGDVLVQVDGTAVSTPAEIPPLVRVHPPGTVVNFGISRNGKALTVPVALGTSPRDSSQGFAGIQGGSSYSGPFTIKFGLDSVGGPSAGMMFSLGIVDKLTPGELNDGKVIAGTGTVDATGAIGPIGGMQQKLAAARDHGAVLFLVPEANCDEVSAFASPELNVAKVSTLTQAVDVINLWKSGSTELPRCPVGA